MKAYFLANEYKWFPFPIYECDRAASNRRKADNTDELPVYNSLTIN